MATIVFDVNETLLDLSGLDEVFAELFDDRGGEVKRLWFARLLHLSSVMTLLGTFQDFGVLASDVLRDHAGRLGFAVSEDEAGRVLAAMRDLPAHADAKPAIASLKAAGHRVVALTNSGQQSAIAQLSSAGLDVDLEAILSADESQRFKPDRQVYDDAAETLGVGPAELVLVACHDWDCAGAMKAGWRSGYVARPGTGYSALLQPPTWRADDLLDLAQAIGDGRD